MLEKVHPLHHLKAYATGLIALFLVAFIFYIQYGENQLDKIYKRDIVRFVIRDTPANYYAGGDEIEGFEYKMAELYADYLGVNLQIVIEDNVKEVFEALDEDRADIAAAGLTVDVVRAFPIRYGQPYQTVNEQVIYLKGKKQPKTVADLSKGRTVVTADSSYLKTLQALEEEYPDLKYEVEEDLDSFELLSLLSKGEIDYTIVDSHELEQFRRFEPELRVGFSFKTEQELAWAFKPVTYYTGINNILENLKEHHVAVDKISWIQNSLPLDDSLPNSADEFFNELRDSGQLEYWLDVYYGHILDFDYIDTKAFIDRTKTRLPTYEKLFIKYAEDDLDWKLLAAIGYQESHWRPNAVSPTGVRGLMMLTMATARSVSVADRTDPEQSIMGGARYFRRVHDLLPAEIQEPDRTWMALASYNVGMGHVLDVRKWVAREGGDPNKWHEVRKLLPKKRVPSWYANSKYGFARGNEAVVYVENIRRYYDMLKWKGEKEQ